MPRPERRLQRTVTARTMAVMEHDLSLHPTEDLRAAVIHFEDLDIFVGQRSRMHPGPGWAVALAMIREDLAILRRYLRDRADHG